MLSFPNIVSLFEVPGKQMQTRCHEKYKVKNDHFIFPPQSYCKQSWQYLIVNMRIIDCKYF